MNDLDFTRVVVCGSRQLTEKSKIIKVLDTMLGGMRNLYVCHGAGFLYVQKVFHHCGADYFAEQWAFANRLTVKRFHPDLEKHKGKSAFHIRNLEMIKYAAEVRPCYFIAFWDGESEGTKSMIQLAKKYNFCRKVVQF